MKKLSFIFIFLLIAGFISQTAYSDPSSKGIAISGTKTIGTTGDYTSITAALVDITIGLEGPVILELMQDYVSSVETFPLTFSSLPTSSSNTITIRPQTGVTGLSITSAAAQTIYINGGSYIIFDGRPGGLGTASQLTIDNSLLAGNTFRFINDAQFNTIQYCTVSGVNNTPSGAVINFSTTTGTLGNSNNTIDNCTIKDGASTPATLIYSLGTATAPNANNVVTNSNFLNWFLALTSNSTSAIYLTTANTAWTITGNSFYQTATRNFGAVGLPNLAEPVVYVNNTGVGYTISNNYIGGSAPNCGGAPMSFTASTGYINYYMIYLNTTTAGTASNISGNTIANMTLSTYAYGLSAFFQSVLIYTKGNNVNITNNTIGSQSATDNITYTTYYNTAPNGNWGYFISIYAGGAASTTSNVTGNNVGGITISGSATTNSVRYMSFYTEAVAGNTLNISNNTIGGTVANSIKQNSGNRNEGIVSLSASLNQSYTNNIVRNLNINYTGALLTNAYCTVAGLALRGAPAGKFIATGNTIYTLTTNSIVNPAGTTPANIDLSPVIGIVMTATSTSGTTISQNTIYDLRNTNASASGPTIGMCFKTPTNGVTVTSQNLIHSFSTVSNTAQQFGILHYSGQGILVNNMIRLGIDATGASITTNSIIYGIYKSSAATVNLGVYYNSLYIGGSGVAGTTSNTSAYYRAGTSTGTDTLMNNILYNGRSNISGTGSNYGIYSSAAITSLLSNYNDIVANGTSGAFGYAGGTAYSNLAGWQGATSKDMNSVSGDPQFINPTGNSSALNLHINPAVVSPVSNSGTPLTAAAALVDFDGDTRSVTTPDIGADEYTYVPPALTLNLTALLEGFYNGTTMVPDTVTVELRNNIAPYTLVESQKVLLSSAGASSPVYTIAVNGTPYYIVIKNRNHIETWSTASQTFSGSALSYDFTTSATQAYGSNMVLVGTKWCLYGGDNNLDGSVDALDMIAIDNDATNFVTGYVPTDLNGDGSVDALDMIICDNNSSIFVGAIKPPGALNTVKIPKTYEQMQAIEKYMKNRIEQKQKNDKMQKNNSTKPVIKSNN